MKKIPLILKSRTTWTLVVLFVINGLNGIHDMIPAMWLAPIDSLLGVLAIYFHVNPRQNYTIN